MCVCVCVCVFTDLKMGGGVPTPHPKPSVPSVAQNTQADDTLPSIAGRGGANCRIGSHLRRIPNCSEVPDIPGNHPPRRPSPSPPPSPPPPLPAPPPPPPKGPPANSWLGGCWRPKPSPPPPGAWSFLETCVFDPFWTLFPPRIGLSLTLFEVLATPK